MERAPYVNHAFLRRDAPLRAIIYLPGNEMLHIPGINDSGEKIPDPALPPTRDRPGKTHLPQEFSFLLRQKVQNLNLLGSNPRVLILPGKKNAVSLTAIR